VGDYHLLACPVVQGEAVAEVASIWSCKNSVAKTLLMHYMWDKDKLMSECWLGAEQTQAAHNPSVGDHVAARLVSCGITCGTTGHMCLHSNMHVCW
jgi:hypothetical protein